MQTQILNNGVEIPTLGYGVYQITDLKECQKCVEDALEVGYRHIDTASFYQNEEAVGEAIKASYIKREEIFITTKVWIQDISYDGVRKAFEKSMRKLQLDYLDLYLIHQPYNDCFGAWRAMEELYTEGVIRSIGVSNFYPNKLMDFYLNTTIKPMINQIEINPLHQQNQAIALMKELEIKYEAWAPFAEGKNNFFECPTLVKIGEKYNKTSAQVALRWGLQKGAIVLSKTTHKERMQENLNVFDFELSQEDMLEIEKFDTGKSAFFEHTDPKVVRFLHTLQ